MANKFTPEQTLERLAYKMAELNIMYDRKEINGPMDYRVRVQRAVVDSLAEQSIDSHYLTSGGVKLWELEENQGLEHDCYIDKNETDDEQIERENLHQENGGPFDDLIQFLEALRIPLDQQQIDIINGLKEGRVVQIRNVDNSSLGRFKYVYLPSYIPMDDRGISLGSVAADIRWFMDTKAKDIIKKANYQDLTDALNVYLQIRGYESYEIDQGLQKFVETLTKKKTEEGS